MGNSENERFRQELVKDVLFAQAQTVNGNTFYTNYVNDVKVNPTDVELKAIVNHDMVATISFLIGVLVFVASVKLLGTTWFMIPSAIITTGFILTVVSFSERMMLNNSKWHVLYKNGALTVDGRKRIFGDEIYDMKIKRGLLNSIIIINAINTITEGSTKPYELTIKFLNHADAHYVYSIFWSRKKSVFEK